MKVKLLVAALAAGTAAQAGAATIDNGVGGNGGVFFNVWDSNGSYVLNLHLDLDTFESKIATPGYVLTVAADDTLKGFLTGRTAFKWDLLATDSKGDMRILETAVQGAATTAATSTNGRTAAGQVSTLINSINAKLGSADSATYAKTDPGYIAKTSGGIGAFSPGSGLPLAGMGTEKNNSFANGLNILQSFADAAGTAKYTPAVVNASYRAWLDDKATLHVAAVPEPETYAMLMAGLGLLGAVARRRAKRA